MNQPRRDLLAGLAWSAAFLGMYFGGEWVYQHVHLPDAIKPKPSGKGAWAIVVVDDTTATIAEGQTIDGPTLRALKPAGKCRVVSVTGALARAKGYDTVAKAVGCPCLLVLDAAGKPVATPAKLPANDAALRAYLSPLITDLPPPLPDVKADDYLLAAAAPAEVKTDPANGLDYIVTDGHKRILGSYPSKGLLGATLPAYGDSHVVFPVQDWIEVNRRNIFGGTDWILDQDGISSCVANGGCGIMRRTRALAGMKDVKLSPGYLYSLINGGRDAGASISDILTAGQNVGFCTYETVGEKPFYTRQMPAACKQEAPRFKIEDCYHAATWEEVGSALLTGRYCVVFGFQVGNSLGNFDKFGVGGHASGPGNHCVMSDGLKKLDDGRWVLDTVNSWNYSWGPWKNGRVYLDRNHLFGGGDQPDVCVIRASGSDPKEPYDPPVYAGKAIAREVALAP